MRRLSTVVRLPTFVRRFLVPGAVPQQGNTQWSLFSLFGDSRAAAAVGLPVTTAAIAVAVNHVLAAAEYVPILPDAGCSSSPPSMPAVSDFDPRATLSPEDLSVLLRHALASKETNGEVTFSGRDLRGLFPGNRLEHVVISATCLERMDFSGMTISHVTGKHLSFQRSAFVNCVIEECLFEHCNFEGCLFAKALLRKCRFVECKFNFASWETCSMVEGVAFVDCDVDLCDMTRLVVGRNHFGGSESSDDAAATVKTHEDLGALAMSGTQFVRCRNWSFSRRALWRYPTSR